MRPLLFLAGLLLATTTAAHAAPAPVQSAPKAAEPAPKPADAAPTDPLLAYLNSTPAAPVEPEAPAKDTDATPTDATEKGAQA